jgi:hypothetical protein
MRYLRSIGNSSSFSIPATIQQKPIRHAAKFFLILFTTLCVAAQDQSASDPSSGPQAAGQSATITIPAGTRLALVLTHPIQSRYVHRGDDIYAQITSPVNSGNEMVIPPGTFVQGTVDKLGKQGGRGDLRLQSMAITFADGYVAPVSGPITIETNDGYAIKDPGNRRAIGALALPAAGAGVGALIGYAAGGAGSTQSTTLPPGCVGGPPFCLSTSTPVFGTKGRDAIIGAGVGGAIGALASMALLFGSHNFLIDVGAPVEMTLQQPVLLDRKEVDAAVKQAAEHPVAEQPTLPRPTSPPAPDIPVDHGTCYTPGTPGTPPTVIPGTPGPDGIPGPATTIPGTPPTPGTPYPCP